MKFFLLIAAVSAINISSNNLPEDDPAHPCTNIGESFAPVSTAKCIEGAVETWSVQDWKEIRTVMNPNCNAAKPCCYKIHHGHDENLGTKAANCDRKA